MKILKYIFSIFFGIVIFASQGQAHHQLGLPHYLYSKDYPQIPTMVIEADAEGYLVTFSIFPGNPRPGQIVRIKTYIKHKLTGEVYTKPIQMSVSQETFFGGEQEIVAPKTVACDYNEYKMSYEFKEAEKFYINVKFEPRADFFEKIPFPIVIGKTNFNMVPIIFGAVFLVIFIGVGLTKKRQGKRV
ncbi:MAG: hypothetical protein ACE5HS_19540 [bacterium]